MKIIKSIFLIFLSTLSVHSQVLKEDYQRADSMRNFRNLVYNNILSAEWIASTHQLWYLCHTAKGKEYKIVDAIKRTDTSLFNQEKFCELLNKYTGKNYLPYDLPLAEFKVKEDLKTFEFILNKKYTYNLTTNSIDTIGELPPAEPYWGNSYDELANGPVTSPDSIYEAFVKNFNVYIREKKSGTDFQLSFDGSEGEFYSSFINWSPDSKKIVTFKVRDNKKRYLYLIESTPDNQFLPVFHQKEYLRPGDALPVRLPALFNIANRKNITLNTNSYINQFSVDNLQWDSLGNAFTFEFNQRGHQVYQVVRVDALTGALKTIIDEQSSTFIDYSGKRYRYDLKKSNEIIWASERDGWNHLYLFDANSGELKNRITHGNWVVRSVETVDEKKRFIIFSASGLINGEDPYYIHYYRINFDGSDMIELTPEKANHQAIFSYDGLFFLDTYSTVKTPPVSVLCSATDGQHLIEVEKATIDKLLTEGYIFPEPFMAKGRDGVTEIWGNIYRPVNFDSTRTYPIIEFIYAGPQGSYVQKSFAPYMSPFSGLAELGFIIVFIDGMGTSNRSKAFQDVCFKNLKDAGFADRILWIKSAASKYHYMDTTRVGIFGGSAGGQNAAAALLFHPGFYKVGVASCGCHDNRIDKMWWNEQWLGYPIGPEYAACSNIENASLLNGKLLLIVGELDDNVDPSSTFHFADALIKANKDFELVVLPGTNHTLGGDFGERKRRDFFIRYLYGIEPPNWNK